MNSYRGFNKRLMCCGILCGISLSITGCINYFGLHQKQRLKPVEELATKNSIPEDNGHWPSTNWAVQFDTHLPQLIQEGLENNPDLQTAVARQQQAQAIVKEGQSALLPRVNFYGLNSRSKALLTTSHLLQNLGVGALNFSYELDFWGKNYAQLAQALSNEKVSQATLYQSQLILSTSIATTYNQLDYQYQLQKVLVRTRQQRALLNKITKGLLSSGLATNVQVYQAMNTYADVSTQLVGINGEIEKTRLQLGVLLGKGPDRGLSLPNPHFAYLAAPKLPDKLPLHLLGRRPDIVAARWQVEAALHHVKYVKAQFYPDVNLLALAANVSLGAGALFRDSNQLLAYATAISLPLFDGGYLRAQVQQNYAIVDEKIATYNAAVNQALGEVAQQITMIHTADAQLKVQKVALEAAGKAYFLARKQYELGLTSQLVVLNTETQYLVEQQARLELIKGRRDLQIALIKSLGGGFEERFLPTPRTTVTPNHILKKDEHV